MCYFSNALNVKQMEETSKMFREIAKVLNAAPSHVIGRGISGVLALPHIAKELKCQIAVSRKKEDSSHGGSDTIEYMGEMKSLIIVDDFVETGSTILSILDQKIKREMRDRLPKIKIQACFYYDGGQIWSDSFKVTDLEYVPAIGVNLDNRRVIVRNVTNMQAMKIEKIAQSHNCQFENMNPEE